MNLELKLVLEFVELEVEGLKRGGRKKGLTGGVPGFLDSLLGGFAVDGVGLLESLELLPLVTTDIALAMALTASTLSLCVMGLLLLPASILDAALSLVDNGATGFSTLARTEGVLCLFDCPFPLLESEDGGRDL